MRSAHVVTHRRTQEERVPLLLPPASMGALAVLLILFGVVEQSLARVRRFVAVLGFRCLVLSHDLSSVETLGVQAAVLCVLCLCGGSRLGASLVLGDVQLLLDHRLIGLLVVLLRLVRALGLLAALLVLGGCNLFLWGERFMLKFGIRFVVLASEGSRRGSQVAMLEVGAGLVVPVVRVRPVAHVLEMVVSFRRGGLSVEPAVHDGRVEC